MKRDKAWYLQEINERLDEHEAHPDDSLNWSPATIESMRTIVASDLAHDNEHMIEAVYWLSGVYLGDGVGDAMEDVALALHALAASVKAGS